MIGLGNVTGPHPNTKPNHKPIYRWKAAAFEDVKAVIAMLWEWLGERRRAKAQELLVAYKEYTNVRRYKLATDSEVTEVKRLLSSGFSKRKIAKMVGRSYGFVNHIKRGRTHQGAEVAP